MNSPVPPNTTSGSPSSSAVTSPEPSETRARKVYKSWAKDDVDGGPSSMDILVDWLSTGTNYARWRGKGAMGASKKSLCAEIQRKMAANGLDRLPKDIQSKIATLQSGYNHARDWLENTGEGLRGRGESEETIHGKLWNGCITVIGRELARTTFKGSS
jgi:hypothetical protein